MNVIGYIRTSTEKQEVSPEAQRQALAAWCQAHGAELVTVHEDLGVSSVAAPEDRPGLSLALASLRRGDVLLAVRRDRIARDPIIAAVIEHACRKVGARLAAVDTAEETDPVAIVIRRAVDDMVSAIELQKIRARTRAALQAKKARGERVGGVPYGSALAADGVHLVPAPAEREVIEAARELRAAGLSLRAIAAELAGRGFNARKGGTFSAVQVSRMVA